MGTALNVKLALRKVRSLTSHFPTTSEGQRTTVTLPLPYLHLLEWIMAAIFVQLPHVDFFAGGCACPEYLQTFGLDGL